MLLKFYFFRARFFYEKTAKTLCVTIRNFAQFYFVYLYAKITRFLINERRTYPYIQVGSLSLPSLAPLATARKPCGPARRAGYVLRKNRLISHLLFYLPHAPCNPTATHTQTRQGKARCSPLNRLAKQRVSFCRNRRFFV